MTRTRSSSSVYTPSPEAEVLLDIKQLMNGTEIAKKLIAKYGAKRRCTDLQYAPSKYDLDVVEQCRLTDKDALKDAALKKKEKLDLAARNQKHDLSDAKEIQMILERDYGDAIPLTSTIGMALSKAVDMMLRLKLRDSFPDPAKRFSHVNAYFEKNRGGELDRQAVLQTTLIAVKHALRQLKQTVQDSVIHNQSNNHHSVTPPSRDEVASVKAVKAESVYKKVIKGPVMIKGVDSRGKPNIVRPILHRKNKKVMSS